MEPYYIGEVPESRRKLLRALGIEVVDLPADEVILFRIAHLPAITCQNLLLINMLSR